MKHLHTQYLQVEGRASMERCIRESFKWCVDWGVEKIVMFTGTGEGPMYAVENLLIQEPFSAIQMIAVSPPTGKLYKADTSDSESPIVSSGVPPARKEFLREIGIPVISAHLPFSRAQASGTSDWTEAAQALGILGGGVALCVQAVLLACDAGEVQMGERVVAVSADTAISALASRTETFLSPSHGLLVEHFICRPRRYNISKPKHVLLNKLFDFWEGTSSNKNVIEGSATPLLAAPPSEKKR
jgi:hypothetical protein